jgi:hypothetical protein
VIATNARQPFTAQNWRTIMRPSLKTLIPLAALALAKLTLATALIGAPLAIGSIVFAESAHAQTDGKFVDLTDPENQKKGHKPFNLSTPACSSDKDRLVAKATTKRVCVSTSSGAYWRIYSMEIWACFDDKNVEHQYRKVTGFRETNEPCEKADWDKLIEEGKTFGETWPDNWPKKKNDVSQDDNSGKTETVKVQPPRPSHQSTMTSLAHAHATSPPSHRRAAPPSPSTPGVESPPSEQRSSNFH